MRNDKSFGDDAESVIKGFKQFSDGVSTIATSTSDTNASFSLFAQALQRDMSIRDWLEDFSLENGNYNCLCLECSETFIGHKRRVRCRICNDADR